MTKECVIASKKQLCDWLPPLRCDVAQNLDVLVTTEGPVCVLDDARRSCA